MFTHRAYRYGLAIFGVAVAMWFRLEVEAWIGPGLPTYITFYPVVMVVAIFAGIGPGIFATALTGLVVDYFIIPPVKNFSIGSHVDQIGFVLFMVMGLSISLLSELYRRNRDKAAACDRDVTYRLTQDALNESEQRFRLMVNAMPQLGWIGNADGYITWYNDRWYSYTGTEPQQMEGWGWQSVHDEVELPKVLERWKASIAMGLPFEMTFPLRGADGKFRQFLTRGFPLKNSEGTVVQWFGTNTDVEEQTRSENLLRHSEVRFRSLVEQAADGIFVADSQGNYIDVNTVGCNMLGYSLEEILKLNIADVIDPEEIPRIGPEVARFADGLVKVSEWRFRRKDLSSFLGEVRGRQLTNGNLQAVLIDITERKRAEVLLAESEKQYRTLFENMLDGYAHCRMLFENEVPKDFLYLGVNEQFERLTGLKNVVGKKVSEVIPGVQESNPELFEIYGRVALSGKPEKFETHVEALGVWLSLAVYSNIRGEFVVMFQDVTKQKRIEQELLILNNHLSHEVANRTAELSGLTAHIQTIAEKERAYLARELHDELGSTLVGMSMEVGHLISKVKDVAHLKGLGVLKELITHAVEVKRHVVDELYPSVLEHDGFTDALKWMASNFKAHSSIQVELLIPEAINIEDPYSLAAYRITQESLTNIAKHAKASLVRIEVYAKDGFLELAIHDNGIGLPSEIKRGSHGIMGMTERARYLGGSVSYVSEKGKGTTAYLRLPLFSAKQENKKRVLVVDDHAIVRDALRRLISETDDFSVGGEATDGKSAVEMGIEGEWDIILLDISLPKMNGLEALEKIRAAKPDVAIIILSSYAEDEYGDEAVRKGAACYLEKGATDRLVEEMRRVTRREQ